MGSQILRRGLAVCLGLAALATSAAKADDEADLRAAFAQGEKLAAAADYANAARHYERALALAPKVFGESESTAAILNNLANLYRQLGQFAKAEPLLQRSLKIKEATLGTDHLNVARSLSSLGALNWEMGQYDKAEPLLQRSLKIIEARLGPDHLELAAVLNNLAILFRDIGQYAKAEALHERTLKIREARLGPDHLDVAQSLNNLAVLYRTKGQYAEAEPLYLRSLKIREAKLGANHPDVAGSLVGIAILYWDMGQYAKAEPLYQRGLEIREAKLGANHPDVANALNNLALLYSDIGQYAKAEPLYRRSLKIYESTLGTDHPDVALALNNLAIVHFNLGQHAKAEPLYQRAMEIREAKLGANHPDVASPSMNLALLYSDLGQYAKAEPFYLRALKIFESNFGADHPDVATALNNLALLYSTMGQHGKAEPLYRRSLEIREAKLGAHHPDVASSLNNLAMLDIISKQPGRAAARIERARRMVRRHVASVLPLLSEKEQAAFLNQTDRTRLGVALSLALHSDDSGIVEMSAGWLANGKAVAQGALAERAQLARDARDPKLLATVKQLQAVRGELAARALTTAKPGQEAAHKTRFAELSAQEQTLAKQIAAARGQAALDDPWVSIAQIRDALPAGAVLVDIARINVIQFAEATADRTGEAKKKEWLGQHYVAWIVPAAGAGEVRVVDLGAADTIDAAIAAYQKEIAGEQVVKALRDEGEIVAEKQLAKPLAEIARLVLAPLLPHFKDAKQIMVSPDAGLWLVPWGALPVGEGEYAIERWPLRYVIAGREVALEKLRKTPVKPGPPRIFANPDYDLPQRDAQAAFDAVFKTTGTLPARAAVAKSSLPEDKLIGMRSAWQIDNVGRLPGTADEAASIAPKLKALTNEEAKSYLDRQAQEAVFKRLGSPRVLLMSTHGFFLPDQHAKTDDKERLLVAAEDTKSKAALDAQGNPLENPLLRCGLLLAGCNQRDKWNSKELGDGVLTGLEIVGADLRGTELVVLSACETGLGQVNNGEGVAGLRQAFQIAGARTVVSTLWQIPDKQSAQLMTDFFSNLAAGQSKPEALRNAQLKMIKERRDRDGAAHPFYWAAWTVTGP